MSCLLALAARAGNQVNVIVGDIVQKMLVESCAVVCKMNPVNEYAGPLLEEMLQPLVRSGALRFAYGGGKEGALLCNHPAVDSMHITGSHVTHDAIVWGGQPKARCEQCLEGCVVQFETATRARAMTPSPPMLANHKSFPSIQHWGIVRTFTHTGFDSTECGTLSSK